MHVGADQDPEPGAGIDVDVGVDAALADELEIRQPLEQRALDSGALPDEDERLRTGETRGQHVDGLHVVGEDGDVVPGQLGEAVECAQRVEVVVQDYDLHGSLLYLTCLAFV